MRQVIVIPARLKGKRLPGKPLIKIDGIPMIQHVYNRCLKVMKPKDIYVATEDKIIQEYCKNNKINCINTGKAQTAIFRVKLFSDKIKADAYINVQGDEPIVNILDIKKILKYNKKYPQRVVFGKTICDLNKANDSSKAKVVCSNNGRLLYSSREKIPFDNGKKINYYSAVWIYAFSRENLLHYSKNFNKSIYDKIEGNEVLSFIENDIDVYCISMSNKSWAVDVPKDVKIVERIIKNAKKNI